VPGPFSRKPNPLAGRVVAPAAPAQSPAQSSAQSPAPSDEAGEAVEPGAILCGYNVPDPGPFKTRQKIPRGWGLFAVDERRMTLRPKSRRAGRLVQPIALTVAEVATAAPIQPNYLSSNLGVVVRRADGANLYVWTDDPQRVLDRLQDGGFRVSRAPVEVSALE
jgi:hypothetical protein